MPPALELTTRSPEDTDGLGAAIGALVAPGDVLALAGELGTGKTALARGIARGLGLPRGSARSPTFALLSRFDGGRVPLIHVDAYRLAGPEGLVAIGLDEAFDPGAATVVEWAPRVAAALPEGRLEIAMEHVGPTERRVTLSARGARAEALLGEIARAAVDLPGR